MSQKYRIHLKVFGKQTKFLRSSVYKKPFRGLRSMGNLFTILQKYFLQKKNINGMLSIEDLIKAFRLKKIQRLSVFQIPSKGQRLFISLKSMAIFPNMVVFIEDLSEVTSLLRRPLKGIFIMENLSEVFFLRKPPMKLSLYGKSYKDLQFIEGISDTFCL